MKYLNIDGVIRMFVFLIIIIIIMYNFLCMSLEPYVSGRLVWFVAVHSAGLFSYTFLPRFILSNFTGVKKSL